MKASASSRAPSGNPSVEQQPRIGIRRRRSRVTNGRALFAVGPQTSAYARRLRDILGEIISDLGGPSELSEAERQLARRAASLSVACEKLEETICTGVASSAAAAFCFGTTDIFIYRRRSPTSRHRFSMRCGRGRFSPQRHRTSQVRLSMSSFTIRRAASSGRGRNLTGWWSVIARQLCATSSHIFAAPPAKIWARVQSVGFRSMYGDRRTVCPNQALQRPYEGCQS